MKIRIKKFIAANPALEFLLPLGQFVFGFPYELRNVFFREILRFRLLVLWLVKQQPLILYARFGGIGDILCSLPAYAAACRAHPAAHGVFITLTEFQNLPALAKAPGSVCASRAHCAIPRMPRWLVFRTFVPQYPDELGQETSPTHLVDEFYRACGMVPESVSPGFALNAGLVGKVREMLPIHSNGKTKIVVIHPGPSWKVKEWPAAYWQTLVDNLRATESVRILQIGAHRHITIGKAEAVALAGVESLVDKLSLGEIAALLTLADLFVGIDSGMIHMAGAAGTPAVGIFGPTDPARILRSNRATGLSHPLPCSFCHHRQPRMHWQSGCPQDIACMRQLQPETVLQQCLGFLNRQPSQRI